MSAALRATFGGNADPLLNEFHKIEIAATHAVGHIKGAIGAAISIGAIESLAHETLAYADKVGDLSQRLGVSTDAIQEWDYALRQNGSTIDNAATFFKKLAVNRQAALQGNDEQIKSFERLGVTIDNLKNKRLEDIGLQISKVFEGADPQVFIADLVKVGGKGADELVAAFRNGFEEIVKSAKGIGVVIDDDTIEKLKEVDDAFKTIGATIRADFASPLATVSGWLEKSVKGLSLIAAYIKGFGSGGIYGASAQFLARREQIFEEEAAAAKRREEKKKKLPVPGLDEDTSKADKKEYDELEKLQNRLQDLKDKNFLKFLDKQGQLEELQRRKMAADEIANSPWLSSDKILKAQIKSQEIQGDILGLDKEKLKVGHGSLTSLQQVGSFSGPPVVIVDIARKQLNHLKSIDDKLSKQGAFRMGEVKY